MFLSYAFSQLFWMAAKAPTISHFFLSLSLTSLVLLDSAVFSCAQPIKQFAVLGGPRQQNIVIKN